MCFGPFASSQKKVPDVVLGVCFPEPDYKWRRQDRVFKKSHIDDHKAFYPDHGLEFQAVKGRQQATCNIAMIALAAALRASEMRQAFNPKDALSLQPHERSPSSNINADFMSFMNLPWVDAKLIERAVAYSPKRHKTKPDFSVLSDSSRVTGSTWKGRERVQLVRLRDKPYLADVGEIGLNLCEHIAHMNPHKTDLSATVVLGWTVLDTPAPPEAPHVRYFRTIRVMFCRRWPSGTSLRRIFFGLYPRMSSCASSPGFSPLSSLSHSFEFLFMALNETRANLMCIKNNFTRRI